MPEGVFLLLSNLHNYYSFTVVIQCKKVGILSCRFLLFVTDICLERMEIVTIILGLLYRNRGDDHLDVLNLKS